MITRDLSKISDIYTEMYQIIEERIILKKYTDNSGKIYFIVDSDLEGYAKGNETFKNKDKISKSGLFMFDRTNLKKWISKQSFMSDEDFDKAVPQYRAELNKIQQQDNDLEDIGDYAEVGMKDKVIEFLKDLKEKIRNDSNSPEIQKFFEFRNKFRKYSLNNQILIFMQNQNASKVAGKVAWAKLNRKLKLGSKGIYIFVPINAKDRDTGKTAPTSTSGGAENTNVDETKFYTRFILKPVFDILDTEVIPGKEDKVFGEPQWFDDIEVDEKTELIYNALESFAAHENIEVKLSSDLQGARGVSKMGSIELVSRNISTLIHEIAHELLHTKEDRINTNKEIKELEAEGVAYTVLRALELPAEHASKYLALWKIDPDNVPKYEKRISTVSLFIYNYIDIYSSGGQEEANRYAAGEERKWANAPTIQEKSFKRFFEKRYKY